jgi:DNA-binding NarL/FixJ family response regulator
VARTPPGRVRAAGPSPPSGAKSRPPLTGSPVLSPQIVIAEDNLLVREGIKALLEISEDIDVVGVCESYESLLESVDTLRPDVVLTDIRMPPSSTDEGIRAANEIRTRYPETGVVVLSQHDEPDYALALFDGGTARRAYLLKDRVSEKDQLLSAIQEVARGGSSIDPKVVEALVEQRSRFEDSPLANLGEREKEVLSEMTQGKDNAAVATSLFLTVKTIEKYINSMFAKLGLSEERDVNRRVKAVLLYLSQHE